MAKIVYGMLQSLDGFVDHEAYEPDKTLFRYFIEQAKKLTGSIYGRKLYELMQYWDGDNADWTPDLRAFAQAWQAQPKWVVSRTLQTVGPNATLVTGDLGAAVRKLKDEQPGEIEVGGPDLARQLIELGLVDEYKIYLFPVVLGKGAPFFKDVQPKLRLVASDRIGENVVRLTYRPAARSEV